ncbi:MAG: hypothetical protein ACO1OB_17340 [Archangium sp.]
MSYDLFFTSRRKLQRDEVHGWLGQQPNAFPTPDRVGFENDVT